MKIRTLLAVLLLPPWLGVRPAAADLDDAISARGTLRVATYLDPARPEFFSSDPNAPGFDHEILKGFAEVHKLKLEIVNMPGGSEARLAALLKGRADVVAGRFGTTADRQRQVQLTGEVFPVRFVIVTRRPTPVLYSPKELRSYKVGSLRNAGVTRKILDAYVPATQIDDSFKEPSEYLGALQSGRVQAVILGTELALPAHREDPAVQIGGFIDDVPRSFVYGVRKQDPSLFHALDEYIANLRRTATWSRLLVKYFGPDAPEVLKKARGQ